MCASLSVRPMTLKELQLVHKPSKTWATNPVGTMATTDPYLFSSGTGSLLSDSIVSHLSPLRKLSANSSLLNPSVRRWWFSRSASSSPLKSKPSPKRASVTALTSPCKTRPTRPLPSDDQGRLDSPGKRIRQRPSTRNNRCLRRNSSNPIDPLLPVEFSLDEGAEFQACDLCERLCQQSLDAWIDHLGEFHPIPAKWPSARADSLTAEQKHCPYSAVVGSHKRRRPHIIPRPLNSFMIFAQYLRRATLQLFPDAHNVHLSQRIGLIWRQLDSDLRELYATEANRLQRLHAIEFPDYKYQPKKRIRDADPDAGGSAAAAAAAAAVPSTGTAVVSTNSTITTSRSSTNFGNQTNFVSTELISSPSIPVNLGSTSEWNDIGYDSPDGPTSFVEHYAETQQVASLANMRYKLSRSASVTPQLVNINRPRVAYVVHSTDLVNNTNVPYIPNTLLCMTDTDYVTNYQENFDPCPGNPVVDLPMVPTKQANETLTALVSENQLKVEPDSEPRRSSSFLSVLPSPIETGPQSVTEWTQEKPRPKALEDLLNAPSLFQPDTNNLRTLQLEPLTVVTHVSPGLNTVLESSELSHSKLKQEDCDPPMHSDPNPLPGSLTSSLSTISPDSSLGQQDSVSLACGTYWDPQKRSDSTTAVVLLPTKPMSSHLSAKDSTRTAQYCPNITWNSSEAMNALGDIAMLIENGLHDSRGNTNKAARIVPCSVSPSPIVLKSEEVTGDSQTEFENIDTCGTSPSLDDLGQLILFGGHSQQSINPGGSPYRTKSRESIANDEEGEHTARESTVVNTSNETRCLPSISSWTFGGTLSR